MLTAGPLTVKHIEKCGHEGIMQAISVAYFPAGEADDARPEVIAYGVPLRPGSAEEGGYSRYGNGVVYVMNEAGATVGMYVLD